MRNVSSTTEEEFPEDSISTSQCIFTYLLYFLGLFFVCEKHLI